MNDLIQKYQKVPVKEFPNDIKDKNVDVSICVQTFNHKNYIEKCLDSLLNQETSYHYEILLGEDESSDDTRDICIKYAKKFPDRIRLFLHSRKNNIQINGRASGRFNFVYNISKARGKYIAFCEGDDYWVNTNKLQRQADYFEKNKNLGLIYTGFKKYFQSKNKEHIILYNEENKANNKKGIFDELLINNWIATATVMVRADYLFKYADYKIYTFREFPMADYPAWLDLAYNTSFGCINEPMAVHRILSNSASHSTSAKKRVDFIEASYRIQKYFIQKYTIPEQTIKAVNIKINKKRLQYAFFIKDIQVSHYSKKELKKLGYNLSIREKLYYYSLKSRPLSYLLRKLFIFLGVWI